MPRGLMHMCELCHRATDDLTHSERLDEYLCEPCLIFRAEEYLYEEAAKPSAKPPEERT